MSDANFGKYRLIAELGHGGMADVFLAVMAGPEGSGFSKLTVIKRLRQNLADEPEFIEMLVDEARISARLNHPNVVQTNEVGSVGNHYFIAMEYLDGQPLHRIQHRASQVAQKAREPGSGPPSSTIRGPLPRDCQYLVLADTLAGLHHAHELVDYDGTPLQIVHRDVTPHNVFVTYQGQVKVVDFGIAKAVGRASETRQGVVKGKVRYMAPEQAMGRSIDRRADVFSIGVMLWEAAAGRRLWKDMDDINVVQALISGNLPTSPRPFNPDTPEAIERICVRALAPRASDRYETADDMRMELEQFLAESGALVNSRRTLGATVADLFSDKRDELRVIIEKQLTAMAQRSRGDSLPVHPAPIDSINSSTTSVHQASARSVEAVAINVGGSTSLMHLPPGAIFPPSTAEKPSRSTSPVPMIAAVGIALVSLTVLGAITFRKATPTSTVPVSGAGTQRPAVAVTSASAPDAVDIQLAVSTTPGTARVTLDGIAMTNPVDRRVPRDAREHVVRVEANGFEPFVENVRFERDAVLTVTLVRAASRPPPPPSPPVGVWKPGPRPASTHEQAATPAAVAPTSSPAMPATPSAKPRPKPDIDLGDMWH